MNRIIFAVIIGIMVSIMASVYSNSIASDISDGVVRLHIIANSDSEEDQKIKLMVRDAVIAAEKNGQISTLSDVADTAGEVLCENGAGYSAVVMRGRYYFPTKEYKNVRMPAGMYSAVRVVLGAGEGKNWWCVMYPPLCFTEECTGDMSDEGIDTIRANMNSESADIVTGTGAEIEMKFKIVETAQKVYSKYFS